MIRYKDLKVGKELYDLQGLNIIKITIKEVHNGTYTYLHNGKEIYCTKYEGKYYDNDELTNYFNTKEEVREEAIKKIDNRLSNI